MRVCNIGLSQAPPCIVESRRTLAFLDDEYTHTIEWVRQQLEQVQRSLDHIPRPPNALGASIHVEEPVDDR